MYRRIYFFTLNKSLTSLKDKSLKIILGLPFRINSLALLSNSEIIKRIFCPCTKFEKELMSNLEKGTIRLDVIL